MVGPSYPVKEPDLLEAIQSRLAEKQRSGEIQRLQREAASRARSLAEAPPPAPGVRTTSAARVFYYDPAFTAPREVRGPDGEVLVAAGTRVNPPRIGVAIGFWEPVRQVEVVRHPWCFPSLGGLSLDPGVEAPRHGGDHYDGKGGSFYQSHWYTNPILYWMEVLLEDACLEQGQFDLAYMTELDPLWNDSELTFIINPDVALFANPAAQAVCAADCVAATAGFPLNSLYWCAGCQGSMYPLDGWVASHIGGVQASTLIVQRMAAKMHRELLIWAASGSSGQCGYYPQPLMDKTNYKMQMVYPTPNTAKVDGRCCQTFGRTTAIWGAGKEYPYRGEDYAYMVFRKRNCCATVYSPASLAP